jgi:predicted neuraminidase
MISTFISLPLAAVLFQALAVQPQVPFFESELLYSPVANQHNHAPAIVECSNGDLLVSWYRGDRGERKADNTVVMGARKKSGSSRFGGAFVLADFPGFPDCNTAMFIDSEERLWLFWPLVLANSWESCLTQYRTSTDYQRAGAPVWDWQSSVVFQPIGFEQEMQAWIETIRQNSNADIQERADELERLTADKLSRRLGWQPRCKPIVLPSGRIVLPLYSDTYSVSLMALSDDRGKSWFASRPLLGLRNIQPTLLRRNDGSVVAYMRDGTRLGRILTAESHDEGMTWSPVTATALPNPGAGLDGAVLADGRWVLVYNDNADDRKSLVVSLSDNEGRTWKWTRHLEHETTAAYGKYHYPAVIQSRDGKIHVVYSHFSQDDQKVHRRNMKHATFNATWIQSETPTN